MKIISPIIFIITFALFLIGLGHFVVYKSFVYVFNITNIKILFTVRVLFIIGALSFILTTFITQVAYSKIGSFFYEISSVWLGTLYFLFLASVIVLILFVFTSLFGLNQNTVRVVGFILLFSSVCVSAYGVIHSFDLKVTKYTVPIKNLPDEWNNKNIVMFADSHFGNIRNVGFGKKLVEKINEQNPEVVLIAGDYYDGPPTNYKEIGSLMSYVNSKKGVFFTPGNHDGYGDTVSFEKSLTDAGVVLLDNNIVTISGIQIAGINYNSGLTPESTSNTIKGMNIEKDLPKIFIKHAPTNLSDIESAGFDLVVSGHVHRGQIWPGPWITKKIYKEFSYGLNNLGNMSSVTTSGAGTWGPPQRVGTKSEIVVIKLEKNNN